MGRIPPEYLLYHWDWRVEVVKWGVTAIWVRETGEPHMVCMLCDIKPLRDGEISVLELRTILTLSGARARNKGQQDRRVIPVSAAQETRPLSDSPLVNPALGHRYFRFGKKFRVVMGIVDSRDYKSSIEIRTSRIMDVSESDAELWKREDWLMVFALMVGQPVDMDA